MNLRDKIEIVTGESDAAEEILGLTAEEANLLSDHGIITGEDATSFMEQMESAKMTTERLEYLRSAAEESKRAEERGQSPESAQLDAAIPSGKVAHIPAVDRQIDSVPPREPVDILVGTSRVKNPA